TSVAGQVRGTHDRKPRGHAPNLGGRPGSGHPRPKTARPCPQPRWAARFGAPTTENRAATPLTSVAGQVRGISDRHSRGHAPNLSGGAPLRSGDLPVLGEAAVADAAVGHPRSQVAVAEL